MKKNKILPLLVVPLMIFSACAKVGDTNERELSQLNLKYGLTEIEALDGSSDQIFAADILKTNTFEANEPQRELILKLNKEVFLLKLRTSADTSEIAQQYATINAVEYAEPNFQVELAGNSSTKEATNSSSQVVDSENSDITVAVIDSGVDIKHNDLKNRVVEGYNVLDDNKDVTDNAGHGTHIAGIIANNSNAKIMPIKFTNGKKGKLSDLAKAINFAVDNNANIINLSLGLTEKSSLLKESIEHAYENNIPVVAAAGNYNTNKKYYPAAYSEVIAVSGLANSGEKLPQSNFGTWVDYSVKAQDILSTMPDNKKSYATGTSQAAPFISAKIVEILELATDLDIESLIQQLDEASKPIETGKFAFLLGKTLK